MKKKFLIPLFLLSLSSLLIGCGNGGGGGGGKTPEPEPEPQPDPIYGWGDDVVYPAEENQDELYYKQKYYFYLDYSHSDEPIMVLQWWQNQPLGGCPKEVREAVKTPADPLFPVFIGFSRYSSSIDDSNLWNFAEDSAIITTVKLYGIWTAED